MGGSSADRCSIQRCLPLHGLALDCSTSAHRDRLRDEAPRRSDQEQVHCPRCVFRFDDLHRLSGELVVEGNLGVRWFFWAAALVPFLYVVYELLVGMAAATNSETDPVVKQMIQRSQYWTVVSWLTYPVVYIFPMIGFGGSHAVVAIQVGYCISDIISKCGVGLVIYGVTAAKSAGAKEGALLPQSLLLVNGKSFYFSSLIAIRQGQ